MSRKAKRTELPEFDPAIFGNDLRRDVLSVTLAPLYRSQVRKRMKTLHPASEDKIDAELLSKEARLRIGQSIEACLRQELPGLLAYILDSAWKGNGWACKVILELTGIAEQLRFVASRNEGDVQEADVISEIEKNLVASFRQLVAGEGREEAQPNDSSEQHNSQ